MGMAVKVKQSLVETITLLLLYHYKSGRQDKFWVQDLKRKRDFFVGELMPPSTGKLAWLQEVAGSIFICADGRHLR